MIYFYLVEHFGSPVYYGKDLTSSLRYVAKYCGGNMSSVTQIDALNRDWSIRRV